MKNVQVIPTPNPSRLVKFFTNKFHLCKEILPIHDEEQYQNISITNDEEIKDGDWFLTDDKRVEKCAPDWRAREWHKKIILTTDQDLIKDGVQAIDDEFLEWFVKNPSCEEVEVFNQDVYSMGKWDRRYKIIIPKEEPKHPRVLSENGNELFFDEQGNLIKDEPKQETLEEAETVEEYFLANIKNMLQFNNDALAIRFMEKYYYAKQEQDKKKFSEEELYQLTLESLNLGMRIRQDQLNGYSEKSGKELHKEWFEQNKNK